MSKQDKNKKKVDPKRVSFPPTGEEAESKSLRRAPTATRPAAHGAEISAPEDDEGDEAIDFDKETILFEAEDEGEITILSGPAPLPGQFYVETGRIQWNNNMDFLLSLIGFAVDTANLWGFPYLCLKHGGGSFLIPYCIILVFCVVPTFYMELLIGQFVQQGAISVWKLCPLFKGVGWCMTLVAFFVNFYYNVVLAWSLVYIYESISFGDIRWVNCSNSWNNDLCLSPNDDVGGSDTDTSNMTSGMSDPGKQFFRRHVLGLESGGGNKGPLVEYDLDNLGHPDTGLALCLLLVFGIIFICALFGIKVIGKVVWVTSTTPYIVLGLLLFRGITLPGSSNGLYQYIAPKFETLVGIEVWVDAAFQVFFSLGAGFGIHLTYSSFNTFQHPLFRDCIVTMVVNSGTSILAGMVIFSYLGNVAYSTRQNITDVAKAGPQLVFEVFPQAIGRLPGANFFSCIFFLMMFLMGIDTSLSGTAAITTGIYDEFQNWFAFHPRLRPTFIFSLVSCAYLVSLICVTNGGIYFYVVLDASAASVSLLSAIFLQIIALSYFFGMKEICDAAEAMTGRRPGPYFNICWKFITPSILLLLILFALQSLIENSPTFDEKEVPYWGYIFGLFIAFIPIMMVPIFAVYSVVSIPSVSLGLKFKLAITPDHEYDEVLRTGYSRRTGFKHLFYFETQGANWKFWTWKSSKASGRVAPAPEVSEEDAVINNDPSSA